MNRLGNIIFYVKDVTKTMDFFEKAFGIPIAFIDPSGHYGQMDTGSTALGFASLELAGHNLSQKFSPIQTKELPGCEISFVSKDVHHSLEKAIQAGAELIASPEEKPWGQVVAYVRDFNGILVEIASEMSCEEEPSGDCCGGCCH